jgi:patatin-like phospholipase/acyl hydrolase
MTSQPESKQKFRILALDGGGIRGVMTARILEDVQAIIKQPLNQYFDLIAGTSTGSILAAGLVLGIEPEKLKDIYQERGREIFQTSPVQKLTSWVYGPKYSNQGLIKVLKEELGEVTLREASQNSHAGLLILAYDTLYRNTTFFTSPCPEKNRWFNEMKLWEVCVSSASAPTFFPPYKFCWTDPNDPDKTEWKFPHVDGGISANCPALAALAHATRAFNVETEDISILSIGTGRTTKLLTVSEQGMSGINRWGKAFWGANIPDVFMGSQIQIATDLSEQIVQSANPGGYLRLQFELNERWGKRQRDLSPRPLLPKEDQKNKYIDKKINEEMDDASPENIKNLIEATEEYLKLRQKQIQDFIKSA